MGEVLLFLGRLFSLSYGVQDVDGFLPEVLASRILALHFFANSSAFLVPSKQVSRIPSGFSGNRLGLAGQARW
jgi:hypothetical protein